MDVKQEVTKLTSDAEAIDAALRGDANAAESAWAKYKPWLAFLLGVIVGIVVRYL